MKGKFKLSSFFLGLALIFNMFMPIPGVFAERPTDTSTYGDIEIGGDVSGISDVSNGNLVTVDFTNDNTVTVSGAGLYSENNNGRYFVYASGEITVTAVPAEGYTANLMDNGNLLNLTSKNYTLTSNNHLRVDGVFTNQNNGGQGGNENPQQQAFDGNVYFAWLDGNDNVCYHKFSNFTGRNNDGSYDINYVSVYELTDESGKNNHYRFRQAPANWVLASDMEEGGAIKENLTKEYVFGDGQYDMGVQLDPCNAKDGAHSICTNGDRIFRATIYEEGYQAIKFDTSEDAVDFFPGFWDQTFFTSTVDISGTTPENPAVFETYLLNGSIFFNEGEHSSEITSVTPLDVDEEAVVAYNYDEKWTIWFQSNYYDHVVFEVTAEGGAKYYIRIARVTFNISDNFGPGQENKKVIASFYYPSQYDWTNSYERFDIVATKVKKDGSRETSIVQAIDMIDPFTGDPIPRNSYGGKNLNMSFYAVDVDDDVVGVCFTVVYKGALNKEADFYLGTFSGSGRGIYYDLDFNSPTFRNMRYDV